jgi:hypothetical protein
VHRLHAAVRQVLMEQAAERTAAPIAAASNARLAAVVLAQVAERRETTAVALRQHRTSA